jgi:hypothetical protein
MSQGTREGDWKVFRELHPVALERFCQRVLSEIERVVSDADESPHNRYLAICKLIKERDKDIAFAFNDMRRSIFVQQLARIQYHDLLATEELNRFSPETRDTVQVLIETSRS